ncbi:ADP ATP carrier protein 1 mitochondrial-like isoform X1 [Tripterygium wilfordii]|uniref:ADP ATP carrier protein 1 mitochondrial-like isoform X1 n=1 Tax=Tripterygium wilfordii TaxID=458696 RepID=A0A7J7D6F2_TRIWF|nr:ADP ATP carrier protein 1 mitochondrial-like isoform X1 [Tripterygium wilfordii]
MMTCGKGVKYKSSVDAFSQILKKEGFASLYKNVDAHILLYTGRIGVFMVTFCVMDGIISWMEEKEKKEGSGGGDQSSSRIIDIKWRTSTTSTR